MTGKPDYAPGDLIAAIRNSRKYPIKKGQVFICQRIVGPNYQGAYGVVVDGFKGDANRWGAFRVEAFKKVDPLPPEMWTRDVDVDLLAEREKEDA